MRHVAHFDECPIDTFEVYRKAALKVIKARPKLLRQGACAGQAQHARGGVNSVPVISRTHGELIQKQAG